ncbi:MAG: SDR family oxidoreductase [Trebonia sp.]
MKIAVAGGTGVVGRWTVEALRDGGHEAIVIARSAGIDLVTGDGLDDALAGVEAVVDVTNTASTGKRASSEFFEATAQTLMRATAAAGVRHIVVLSIIGIDRVPYGYYQGKLHQEKIFHESPVPVSILRAAQFHEFPGQYLAKMPGPVVIVPRWRAQPVAAREVGAALARIAGGDPVPMSELAGPREEIMADMVRQVVRARGGRRLVVQVRLPGVTGKAMAGRGGLPAGPGLRGTQTFADWVTEQQARGTL